MKKILVTLALLLGSTSSIKINSVKKPKDTTDLSRFVSKNSEVVLQNFTEAFT
jgi:hypothetical protein